MDRGLQNSADAGFTLVEVVLSLFFLTAALAGVWGLHSVIGRSGSYSEGLTLATGLAQEKADELLRVPMEEAVSGQERVGLFGRRWTVQPGPLNGTLEIEVEVSWQRLTARTSSFRLLTIRN